MATPLPSPVTVSVTLHTLEDLERFAESFRAAVGKASMGPDLSGVSARLPDNVFYNEAEDDFHSMSDGSRIAGTYFREMWWPRRDEFPTRSDLVGPDLAYYNTSDNSYRMYEDGRLIPQADVVTHLPFAHFVNRDEMQDKTARGLPLVAGVYFHENNFYDQAGRAMGMHFYDKWRTRASEYPTNRADAKRG